MWSFLLCSTSPAAAARTDVDVQVSVGRCDLSISTEWALQLRKSWLWVDDVLALLVFAHMPPVFTLLFNWYRLLQWVLWCFNMQREHRNWKKKQNRQNSSKLGEKKSSIWHQKEKNAAITHNTRKHNRSRETQCKWLRIMTFPGETEKSWYLTHNITMFKLEKHSEHKT